MRRGQTLGLGLAHIGEKITESLGGFIVVEYADGRRRKVPAKIGANDKTFVPQRVDQYGEQSASNVARQTLDASIPARYLIDDEPEPLRDYARVDAESYLIVSIDRRRVQNVVVKYVLTLERQ